MRTLALVESPAQLLNVVEWAHQTDADRSLLTTVVLAPRNEMSRLQLHRTAQLAADAGHAVRWCEPRQGTTSTLRTVTALAEQLRGVDRLVLGDPFSGLLQLVLSLSHPREVVVVDDGTATLQFARLWTSGESLVRWHSSGSGRSRRQVAALARRRIAPGSGCEVTVFSCMPVHLDGVTVLHNDFSWVRTAFEDPRVKDTSDLIGTSLVETGVVDVAHYLRGVRALAGEHSIDRYFAHRKEDGAKLAQIEAIGLQVVQPELPLELVVRREVVGQTLISFPSTVVHTLPLVLKGTRAQLLICDIADDWYTRQAPSHADRFLGEISTSARNTHRLVSVAC